MQWTGSKTSAFLINTFVHHKCVCVGLTWSAPFIQLHVYTKGVYVVDWYCNQCVLNSFLVYANQKVVDMCGMDWSKDQRVLKSRCETVVIQMVFHSSLRVVQAGTDYKMTCSDIGLNT